MPYIYSDIIEIPHLGIADVQLLSNQPCDTGYEWTYDGIESDYTARLRWNPHLNKWVSASLNDAEACVASTKSAGSSACDIYLYPFAFVDVAVHGGGYSEYTYSATPAGQYGTNNEGNVPAIKARKLPSDVWAAGTYVYYDAASKVVKNSYSAGCLAGKSLTAAVSGSTSVILAADKAYSESSVNPAVQGATFVASPSGYALNVTTNALLAVDVSGNYFNANSYTVSGGGVATTVYGVSYPTTAGYYVTDRAGNSIWTTYDQYVNSALNHKRIKIVPKFGTSNVQLIQNSVSQKIHVNQGHIQQTYDYRFRFRPYNLLKTSGYDPTAYSWTKAYTTGTNKPRMAFEIPDVSWTPATTPEGPWTPPGAVNYSGSHWMICDGNAWGIYPKSVADTFDTMVSTNKPHIEYTQPSQYGLPNTVLIVNQDGKSDIINPYYEQQWTIDPNREFKIDVGSFSGGTGLNTMRFEGRIVMSPITGTGYVPITSFGDLTKTVTYTTSGGLQNEIHSYSGSLAAAGVTDKYIPLNRYYLQLRQYYIGIRPYADYYVPWEWVGTWFPNTNGNGVGYSYGLNRYNNVPMHLDCLPLRIKTNGNVEITSQYVKGKYFPSYHPDVNWSGDVTLETGTADNGMKKIRLTSSLIPSIADMTLAYGFTGGGVIARIRRKSDGMYLTQYHFIYTTNTNVKGLVWSPYGNFSGFGLSSGSYGTGKYSAWQTYVSQWIYLDAAPNEYEIELMVAGKYYNYYQYKALNFVWRQVRTIST